MFNLLESINARPELFGQYTAADLWTDDHTSEQMLKYHLDENSDISSRNHVFIKKSVEWMIERFDLVQGKKVADFGCGPGLYSAQLSASNISVTGIDFSKRSIIYAKEYARKNDLNINYVNQNYLDFETDERFDLIIMIMCDFCALSPDQRRSLLQKFHMLLKDDGAVLLDVYSIKAFEIRKETAVYEKDQLNGFWSPYTYYAFLNTFKYEKEKVILDKYTVIEKNRTRTIYNWLQYYSPESLEKEFTDTGFRIKNFYKDVAGSAYTDCSSEFAVVARKL